MACETVLTRFEGNPILVPEDVPGGCNSIFNSAVVRRGGAYDGLFRIEHQNQLSRLHTGRSRDGLDWEIDPEPVTLACDDPDFGPGGHTYDPRITELEGRYYIFYANGTRWGQVIGLAVTDDFQTFEQLGNPAVPHNRNAVLFPERIGGKYVRLERPFCSARDLPAGIWYAESPDLVHWGRFRHVMEPGYGWDSHKVGAGAPPIRTDEGWLCITHGVRTTAQGLVYCAGAILLDLEEPWKVRARPARYLLAPTEVYERVGDVPNVVFPCAATLEEGDVLRVYYGGADTVICVAEGPLADVVAFCLEA